MSYSAQEKPRALLSAYRGTVDPGSVQVKAGRGDCRFLVGSFTSREGDETLRIYAHGENIERIKDLAARGEEFFVQGEMLQNGRAISATLLRPKEYAGRVVKIQRHGTSRFGEWAWVIFAPAGRSGFWRVMLANGDARRAIQAGEGGSVRFHGAWKAKLDKETGSWRSHLISASYLERMPGKPSETQRGRRPASLVAA